MTQMKQQAVEMIRRIPDENMVFILGILQNFLSIKYSTPVWIRDRHFQMIQEAYPGLEIFAFPNTDI